GDTAAEPETQPKRTNVTVLSDEGLIYRLPKYLFRITSTPQPLKEEAENQGHGGGSGGTATQSTLGVADSTGSPDKMEGNQTQKDEGEGKGKDEKKDGEPEGEDEAPIAKPAGATGPEELLKVTIPQVDKCPAVEIKIVGPIVVGDDDPDAALL